MSSTSISLKNQRMMQLVLSCCLLILSACSSVAQEGILHRDLELEHDGKTRNYNFYETASQGKRPLVMVLHGGGGDMNQVIGLDATRWPSQVWLDLADEEGLNILVPQGINKHWNDGRLECSRCGDEDDSGFLMSLLDFVEERYSVDRERIFVLGESNGGFMTQRLALEHPSRFAGFGVIIAQLPANSEVVAKGQAVSLMYQLGTEDPLIAFEGGAKEAQIVVQSADETFEFWRNLNQCEAGVVREYPDLDASDSSTVRQEDFDCSKTNTKLSFVVMDGAGHVTPSIEVQVAKLWERLAGVQNHDIESARLLWAFFSSLK